MRMTCDGLLDETYERLRDTGPEFQGWLSNHAPMAADALLRLGRADRVTAWVDAYLPRLHEAPTARWRIRAEDWREPLGDPSRLGDWRALLTEEIGADAWQTVLARWWPRLLPGAAASAAHGLIRTGHAVRALREQDSQARRLELAEALAYWAARWHPIPPAAEARGRLHPVAALDSLPALGMDGGFRSRLRNVTGSPLWPSAAATLAHLPDPSAVPAALDRLVDAAVSRYAKWGQAEPVMLVHAATAPRAASLVLPSLPRVLWPATYQAAWAVTAAIGCAYRPGPGTLASTDEVVVDLDDAVDRAVALGDAHAIKFAETALDAHRRGSSEAALATYCAVTWIEQDS